MRQKGYGGVDGEAASRVHVPPPSFDRMRPHRLVGSSGRVATMLSGFSGSTAMSGVPYWRDGTVSNLVAWTGLVTRTVGAATAPGATRTSAVTSAAPAAEPTLRPLRDRKSTRLNSSHPSISYAVFCLKKKKKNTH